MTVDIRMTNSICLFYFIMSSYFFCLGVFCIKSVQNNKLFKEFEIVDKGKNIFNTSINTAEKLSINLFN